ncbi:hypothetical protein GLOTRDRAFT_14416, partial [Gloeophyllum trabeum ATCC 11539]
ALIRDGYRCPVTGAYDTVAPDMLGNKFANSGAWLIDTECAHIAPEPIYFNVNIDGSDQASNKRDYPALVLTALPRFGYDVDKLSDPKAHSLYNVMTLQHDVHNGFEGLQLWFKETDTANCYSVKVAKPGFGHGTRERVMFSTPDPERLPLPSPQLMVLHATCAKVANLSGAAECLDKLDRDLQTMSTLADDGGSAEVLHHAIASLAASGVSLGA